MTTKTTKTKEATPAAKRRLIHEIFNIADKEERIKKLTQYMHDYITPNTQSKANIYNEATVIFNGKLL